MIFTEGGSDVSEEIFCFGIVLLLEELSTEYVSVIEYVADLDTVDVVDPDDFDQDEVCEAW